MTGGAWSNFGLSAPDASYLNATFDVYDIQFEQSTHRTPYTNSSRSNTQAIIDLTGKNIITSTSLTYSASNAFSFSGADSITTPYTAALNFDIGQTIVIWLLPSENDAARRNPYNQAYGGGGTITHESDGAFNYFCGTAGTNTTPYIGHTSNFTVNINEMACITLTRSLTSISWYKNGVFGNSVTNPYGNCVTGAAPIIIGAGYVSNYIGNLPVVLLYNRALTASEVRQNFNALRGRYGI